VKNNLNPEKEPGEKFEKLKGKKFKIFFLK